MEKIIVKNILSYILSEDDKIKIELINKGNYDNIDEVVAYLLKGGKISTVSSFRICEICGESAGSINYYTDGVWVWPEWLIHYIIEHKIYLPITFIDQIKRNDNNKNLVNKMVNQEVEIEFEE